MQDAVGKEIGRVGGNRRQQEIQRGALLALGGVRETLREFGGVGAVIGRQVHADEQRARPGRLGGIEHGGEVVAHLGERQAAQTVVGAEGDDDDGRLVALQGFRQAGTAAGGGLAGNRDIGDAIIEALFAQALFQQRRPGLFGTDAVTGGERVAHNQDGSRGERRRGGKEQGQQEQGSPHDRETGG